MRGVCLFCFCLLFFFGKSEKEMKRNETDFKKFLFVYFHSFFLSSCLLLIFSIYLSFFYFFRLTGCLEPKNDLKKKKKKLAKN